MSNDSPANSYVVDTVALILRLEQRILGNQARYAFSQAETSSAWIHVPAMVFAEILYLAQRDRIATTLDDVYNYLNDHPQCVEAPLNFAIVTAARSITDVSELHDRLIVATAVHLKAPLLTNDRVIRASAFVQTLW